MKYMNESFYPLLSVVVPVYNNAMFLSRCIESIINQTYNKLEILLIDDGSKDESGELCDKYQLLDHRIQTVHKKNGGTVSARKCGLEHAHGELISFIDGDDWIDKDMYERLIEYYFETNCPSCISSGLRIEYPENQKQFLLMDTVPEKRYEKQDIFKDILPVMIRDPETGLPGIRTSVCTKLMKKVLADKAMESMSTSLALGEDGAYVYFIIANCSSLAIIHRAFYHYEIHQGSQNYTFTEDTFKKIVQLKNVMIEGMNSLVGKRREIEEQINYFIWGYLKRIIEYNLQLQVRENFYLFPVTKCKKESSILIYGAGNVGKSYIKFLERSGFAKNIFWTDQNYQKLLDRGMNLLSVQEALKRDYDYIVIAIEDEIIAKSVEKELLKEGIKSEKIIWERPVSINIFL